jgi:hypothetical protein
VLTVSDLTRARLPKVGRYFTHKIRVFEFLVRIPDPFRIRMFFTKLRNLYFNKIFFGLQKRFLTLLTDLRPFRENICVSKNLIASILFSVGYFCLSGSRSGSLALINAGPVRIRIYNIQTFWLVKKIFCPYFQE